MTGMWNDRRGGSGVFEKKRVLEAAPGKAGERVVFVLAVEGAKKRNKAPVLCWDAC